MQYLFTLMFGAGSNRSEAEPLFAHDLVQFVSGDKCGQIAGLAPVGKHRQFLEHKLLGQNPYELMLNIDETFTQTFLGSDAVAASSPPTS